MARDVKLVCLTGRAKIGGRWREVGEHVEVDQIVLADLAAAGVIDPAAMAPADLAPGMPGFDEAVAAMSKVLADAAVAAAVEAATSELTEERDFYRTGAENAQAELRSLQATNHELEAEIADLKEAVAARSTLDVTIAADAPAEKAARDKASRRR